MNPTIMAAVSASELTVAGIAERDRAGAVALDDDRRVLGDLPAALHQHREKKAQPDRGTRQHEPGECIEDEAVEHVRERVPVGEMLGVLAVDDAVPELDGAAGADRHPAHGVEDAGLRGEGQQDERQHGRKGQAGAGGGARRGSLRDRLERGGHAAQPIVSTTTFSFV
jgi:hypothetical protein